jgi:ankyrin repeat protein
MVFLYFSVILSLLTCLVSSAVALDCSPLVPRTGANQEIQFEGKLTGKVDGIFYKLGGVGVELDGVYSEVTNDVLKEYPDASRTYIWERLIFLQCELLAEAKLNDSDRLKHFNGLVKMFLNGPPTDAASRFVQLEALVNAASAGFDERVLELIELKASPDSKNSFGKSALLAAVENNYHSTVALLLKKGADPNMKAKLNKGSSNEITPLMIAAKNHEREMCILLLDYDAKHRLPDNNGKEAIEYGLSYNKASCAIEFLLEGGYSNEELAKFSIMITKQSGWGRDNKGERVWMESTLKKLSKLLHESDDNTFVYIKEHLIENGGKPPFGTTISGFGEKSLEIISEMLESGKEDIRIDGIKMTETLFMEGVNVTSIGSKLSAILENSNPFWDRDLIDSIVYVAASTGFLAPYIAPKLMKVLDEARFLRNSTYTIMAMQHYPEYYCDYIEEIERYKVNWSEYSFYQNQFRKTLGLIKETCR